MIIKDIKFDPRNYRKHGKKNKELIKKSVSECGLGRSVVIDNENCLVAGNGLVSSLDKNTKVKVVETDGTELVVVKRTDLNTSDEKRRKLAVLDNSTSDSSEFDIEMITQDFSIPELNDLGVEIPEINLETPVEITEDEVPEEVETICKPGNIWKLGEHRLMCGDSTVVTDVEKLMNGEKADMVFTDPPYGIDIVKNNTVGGGGALHFGNIGGKNIVKASTYMKIKGDETTNTARDFYSLCVGLGIEKFIFFGGNYFSDFLPPKPCWIVWDKENTGNFADVELAWTSFEKGAKLYKWLWNGLCRKGERAIEGKSRVHPTQKPVGLIANILKDFSAENEIIFDGFGGSGSTLIACEQLKRKCFMIEFEPYYCDVIIARWEKLTGKKAERVL